MTAYVVLVLAYLLAGSALILFVLFLWSGPLRLVDANLDAPLALAFDALLSLGFFAQHSGMVRKSFREQLAAAIPNHYQPAFYAAASGFVLLVLLGLWQPSNTTLLTLEGFPRWLARGLFLAAIAGLAWGAVSLRYFDPFGRHAILAHLRGSSSQALPLTIRGPYRWVRHPLYACVLLLIWAAPDLTADRVLFNLLWTIWIVVGTKLEERDLVAEFGEDYVRYQRAVPLLLPTNLRPRV